MTSAASSFLIRSIDGVTRTETMVVLSTHTERSQLALPRPEQTAAGNGGKRARRNGERTGHHGRA